MAGGHAVSKDDLLLPRAGSKQWRKVCVFKRGECEDEMRLAVSLCLLFALGILAGAAPAGKPRPEIMGVALDMKRDAARARLQSIGHLENEEAKRQEVWAIKNGRISHLLVGYDADYRVRYVTAIARTDGPGIRYDEVVNVNSAHRTVAQNNQKFIWEISRHGHTPYILIARGHDPQYLDSYSIKKADQEEID